MDPDQTAPIGSIMFVKEASECLELAIDPSPRGNYVHYDQNYII